MTRRGWWTIAAVAAVVALASMASRQDAWPGLRPATGRAENGVERGAVAAPRDIRLPTGMVYVPGGVTQIGSEDGLPDERPVFTATVQPFLMDIHPVTVAQFSEFVERTGYLTGAERLGDGGGL